MDLFIQVLGAAVVSFTLIDVFLTIFYPRNGFSLLTMPLSKVLWRLFRGMSRLAQGERDRVLSFCGSTILVAVATLWVLLLLVGFALIFWRTLGEGIQMSQGQTPTDFSTALYYSGYCLTTLGIGPFTAKTVPYRFLTILEAGLGFAIFTLTLTYFLSVFNALNQRNTFALSLEHRTTGKSTSAKLIAGLGAGGNFSSASQTLSNQAQSLLSLFEHHQAYPVLHYFRFSPSYYSLAQIAFLNLDTVALLKSAIDQQQYRFLVHSSAVTELENGGVYLLQRLSNALLPQKYLATANQHRDEAAWRKWYYRAVDQLKQEKIPVTPDLAAGADTYISLRRQWHPYVYGFAQYMAYPWSQIEPMI